MLQIISGKFFKNTNELYQHEGKGILFSNCKWYSKIHTDIGVLEPVDYSGDITAYVFEYLNQIEKTSVLVRCGDDEILTQFKLISSFGLKSYFSEYREQISSVCTLDKGKYYDGISAKQIIGSTVSLGKSLKNENADHLIELTNKIISLDRSSYKKIIKALKSVQFSIETIQYNIDLAYSLLVYCLESLSQNGSHNYITWDNWDIKNKNKLEEILNEISEDNADSIKSILLEDKHFKLKRRFIDFVIEHSKDAFFNASSPITKISIRRSHFERALRNSYEMRSKFAHALQPIQDQLRYPDIAKQDVFTFIGEPYFTYSGLFRLVDLVLEDYIFSLPSIKKEEFNYRSELPGTMNAEMASQYWIWRPESFNEHTVNQRLAAFLGQLELNEPITDLSKIMEKIQAIFLQTSEKQRAPMLYLFWLYNLVLQKDFRISGWEEFVSKHEKYFLEIRIENIAVRAIAGVELPWDIEECVKVYNKYNSSKFHKSSLSLPALSESIMLSALSNKAWVSGLGNIYNYFIELAISELFGHLDIQKYLHSCKVEYLKVDISKLVNWYKTKKT